MIVTLTYPTEVQVAVDADEHAVVGVRVLSEIDTSEPTCAEDAGYRPLNLDAPEVKLAVAVAGDPHLSWPQWGIA